MIKRYRRKVMEVEAEQIVSGQPWPKGVVRKESFPVFDRVRKNGMPFKNAKVVHRTEIYYVRGPYGEQPCRAGNYVVRHPNGDAYALPEEMLFGEFDELPDPQIGEVSDRAIKLVNPYGPEVHKWTGQFAADPVELRDERQPDISVKEAMDRSRSKPL